MRVVGLMEQRISVLRSALRTSLKLLPWEVAHVGVHHIVAHGRLGPDVATPLWIWLVLLLPSAVAAAYVATLFGRSGRTPYDRIAGTRIVQIT